MADTVRAAGGVVTRVRDGSVEVLLVHRPRYDDWSFPKGKADRGEADEDTARREVHEESGVLPVLHDELETVEYRDRKQRSKRVRYWHMTVGTEHTFEPDHEVDEVRWIPIHEAGRLLTYAHDQALLSGRLVKALEEPGG